MKCFQDEWNLFVKDPLFAAVDAYRRDIVERARLEGPTIKYPSEIDFLKDAQSVAESLAPDPGREKALENLRKAGRRTSRPI